MAQQATSSGAATNKSSPAMTTAKKAPAKKPAKKPTAKQPVGKTTGQTTTAKEAAKKPPAKPPAAKPSAKTRAATLRTDLKKHAGEEYATSELLRGALIMVEREGADAIRAAALALLAGKIPLAGDALSKQAVDSLIRKLTDDYKKLNADDKKALRGVLNWLSGTFELDAGTRTQLVAALSATEPTAAAVATPPPPTAGHALTGLAQGFVLPPKA